MDTGIYTITAPSGNQYVGSASSFIKRWSAHRCGLRSGKHGNQALAAAYAKYGIDGLRFDKLLVCSRKDLIFFEQRAIDILKPKYNGRKIADRPMIGSKQSAELIARRSAGMMGHHVSEETRAKMSAVKRGKKLPEYWAAKLRGKKRSGSALENIRAARRAAIKPRLRGRIVFHDPISTLKFMPLPDITTEESISFIKLVVLMQDGSLMDWRTYLDERGMLRHFVEVPPEPPRQRATKCR